MTRDETKMIVAMIATSYSKNLLPEINEFYINMWHQSLQDLDVDVVGVIVRKWLLTERFPPSIADVRAGVASLSIKEVDPSEAWQELMASIRKFGSYRESEALDSMSEETRRVVERFGYESFCMAPEEELRVLYAQFRDAYKGSMARMKTEAQLPQGMKETLKVLADKFNANKQLGDGT